MGISLSADHPPHTLGYFSFIPKSPKGKAITLPTKLLQRVHMYIGYGDCVVVGGHRYVLTIVDRATLYVWTYGMRAFSGADVIQYIQ